MWWIGRGGIEMDGGQGGGVTSGTLWMYYIHTHMDKQYLSMEEMK